jgi:phage terminase large subunit
MTVTAAAERARVRALLDACRDDPALFQTAVLGRSLWSRQVEICDSVAAFPITVVPGGRAVGKSWLLAGIVLWWLYTRPFSLAITTAPDHRQVTTVLWKEIRRCVRPRFDRVTGARIGPRVDLGYDHLTRGHGSPQRLDVVAGGDWTALGFACATAEGFSGQHAEDLLLIVDEASGVRDEVWDAAYGLAATRTVVTGNPIKFDCEFRRLWDLASTSATVSGVRVRSTEGPDAGKAVSKVGLASATWLDQMREIHGEASPWWRSNVAAEFPGAETTAFIPLAWLDACADPTIPLDPLWRDHADGEVWIGVDPAGGVGADRSTVVVRNGKRILAIFASEWHGLLDDARHRLEPVVVTLAAKWACPGSHVVYDMNGVGRSLGSYLAALGLPGAVGYFGAGKGGPLYTNRRTANAFSFKARLDAKRDGFTPFYVDPAAAPEWPALRRELMELRTPLMEYDEGVVKQRLEDRADLKARLKCSPDLSDALLMTYTFAA